MGDHYWNIRDAIVQSELLLLRMCQFGVKFSHPHKYLLHYLKSLKDWMSAEVWSKYPVARVSWSLLQDLYHDPRVLEPDPSLTALACIQLALETFGIQGRDCKGRVREGIYSSWRQGSIRRCWRRREALVQGHQR